MAQSNTIINHIADILPRHDSEQLSGKKRLGDLLSDNSAQGRRIYHFGMRPTSKSTIARVNEQQPYNLYREMFYELFARC